MLTDPTNADMLFPSSRTLVRRRWDISALLQTADAPGASADKSTKRRDISEQSGPVDCGEVAVLELWN